MKNPNNNSAADYCKSLFLKTDATAGPLDPEWHSEIQFEILVSVPFEIKFQIYQYFWHHEMMPGTGSRTSDTMKWYIGCIYCIYVFAHLSIITPLVNSSDVFLCDT